MPGLGNVALKKELYSSPSCVAKAKANDNDIIQNKLCLLLFLSPLRFAFSQSRLLWIENKMMKTKNGKNIFYSKN